MSRSLASRALIGGVAFGLAATTIEIWLNLPPTLMRGFGAGPTFFVRVAALEILLGALLGLVAAPVLGLRAGRWLQPFVIAILWYGLERWVALDSPLFAVLEFAPPIGGALLVCAGLRLGRRSLRLAWGIGVVLLIAGMLAPPIALYVSRPALQKRAELPPAREGAPDVVLIVLDTVRAGSVSTYGYARPTAPAIDALAAEGVLFQDATSPSTWSLPSHASLFTGRYPSSHGAHSEHRYLDDRYPTLAQVLEANGYETFCFTANAWISDGLGLTRGFAWQDESLRAQGGAGRGFVFIYRLLDRFGLQDTDKGGDLVASRFASWARDRPPDADRPAFVFLNFIEAHFPYHQLPRDSLYRFTDRPYSELREISIDLLGANFGGKGRPVDEVQEQTRDMYDGGVVYTSQLLSRIVESLRERGTLDDTILVVLADHGEILGERGGYFGHGPSFYQESVGVPLLMRYPPVLPGGVRVETPVSSLGVFATIVDLAGIEPPPTLQVGSLVPLALGRGGGSGPILSELHDASAMGMLRDLPDPQMQTGRRYRLFREGSLKLVTTSTGEALLYDLASDPAESRNLAAERPADLAHMQQRLAAVAADLGLPDLDAALAAGDDAPKLDAATQEQLRALGYSE
jgi:arylsulfatase A-like enzyme